MATVAPDAVARPAGHPFRWRGAGGNGAFGPTLLVCGAVLVAHVVTLARASPDIATLGESRLAAAVAVARGAGVVVDPLPLSDRFAALQLAVVETILPVGHLSLVDAGRWACLALGAVSALLVLPVARGIGIPTRAAAVGVALIGLSVPALALHAGLSAGAAAAVWLGLAALGTVRGWGVAAAVTTILAVLTAPLAGAALLALIAHLVLDRTVRPPERFRIPLGIALALASVVMAFSASSLLGGGPLAEAAGPEITTPVAVAASAVGLLLLGLAGRTAPWLRPVLTATALLLVVAVVAGPSRATALLLAAPALAVAAAVLVEPIEERLGARAGQVGVVLVGTLVLALLVPLSTSRPAATAGPTLLAWLRTEIPQGTPIRADALDRAELLAAGVPEQQVRGPGDPVTVDELVLVAARPPGGIRETGSPACGGTEVVAATVRGTGGSPAVVCRSDGAGAAVPAERAARAGLGDALADNPALRLAPAAELLLRDGSVDPRLMLVLAAMTAGHEMTVDDFPAVDLDSPAVPRRQVVLGAVDGVAPAASELLRTWFGAQQPPFVPTAVVPVGAALLVGYPAPPPAGLLPG